MSTFLRTADTRWEHDLLSTLRSQEISGHDLTNVILPFQIRFAFILEFAVNSFSCRLYVVAFLHKSFSSDRFHCRTHSSSLVCIAAVKSPEVPTVAIYKQVISLYKYRKVHRSAITYRQQLFQAFSLFELFKSVQ